MIYFHRPTVLRFWSSVWHRPIVGRRSVNHRPTIGRLLMKNKPFKLGRLSADHRPTIDRQSAVDLVYRPIISRLSADRPIIGRLSADNRPIVCPYKPRPHIFIAFMYTYLVIFAFSKCFLPLAESDLVQTINSIIFTICACVQCTDVKMSYEYFIRRPTVGRSSPDSMYAATQVNFFRPTVGRSSADGRPIEKPCR